MGKVAKVLLAAFATLAAVGAAHAEDSAPTVEKCRNEIGTLAVSEPQSESMYGLRRYGLGSPSLMLRMIIQESGCFAVVERGVAMQNLQQERALAAGGQLQGGSNLGGGQLQAADFVMTPGVEFSGDTGGIGGTVGGLLGRAGGLLGHLGGAVGGVKFKEAGTTLLISDVRSGVQVASADGKASKMDFSLGGWGWGGLGWASASGYNKTPEGKLIAASLLDNYNRIVLSIRDKPGLIRPSVQASRNNAAGSLQATGAGAAADRPAPTQAVPMRNDGRGVAGGGGGAVAVALTGAFSGQFAGTDQGTFFVTVDPDGQVSGICQTTGNESYGVTGQTNPNGSIAMIGNGQAGPAQFSGVINPSRGTMIGTWRIPGSSQRGTFTGKRQ